MDQKILTLLRKHREGLTLAKIQSELGLERRNRNKLLAHLKEMGKKGLVRRTKDRYFPERIPGLVRGRFVTSRRGFGFVTPEGGGEDVFVPARFAEGVLQGDLVEVQVKEKGRIGKPEGRIGRIIKKGRTAFLGTYKERAGTPFVQAFESPSAEDLPLRSRGGLSAAPGTIVEVDRKSMTLSRVIGLPDEPGVDSEVIIRRFGLRSEFPREVIEEASRIPPGLSAEDLRGRRDFRNWTTITIDGEKARDFDDAVGLTSGPDGGYLLAVHIADVSHYVRPGSGLDEEARRRGTSVYFPDRTLPMLPEKLSNDLCSLRPRCLRLAVTVLMEADAKGKIVRTEFTPSFIRTAERMTYTSVFKIFEGNAEERGKYGSLVNDLLRMKALAALLRTRRLAEGSLDFDLVEPELLYEGDELRAVAAAERNDAHRLIEEFMVAANVAVAAFLRERGVAALHRTHPAPAPSSLEKLRTLLGHFGFALPEAADIGPHDLQRVLSKVEGRPEEKFIRVRILRAMQLAVYSEKSSGHYGLAQKDYTHFTSPIRRYPDLFVHRILKDVLAGRLPENVPLAAVALHSSERERNADAAEQSLLEWRIFRFLQDRLGEEFQGTIVDITKAGLVVELDEYFVAGLLPFQALDGDYYAQMNPRSLRGRRRGRTFDMGDRVRVILVSCDPASQRMSFASVPGDEGTFR